MVAYSFNAAFVDQVTAQTKRQTIRLPRKRHARPGEPVQLYTGMRTRHCRKLVDPDPVCIGVDEVRIAFDDGAIATLEINGIPLTAAEMETFARADGFGFALQCQLDPDLLARKVERPAARVFARWWAMIHATPVFHGVLIRWAPATEIPDTPIERTTP